MSEMIKIEPLRKRREINSPNRTELVKRGILLEYFTIGWNLLEGAIAVGAGLVNEGIEGLRGETCCADGCH